MYDYKKSVFKKRIRIKTKQLKWINKNKDTRSAAAYLDKIINYFKKNK